ncbi:MAG: hypothetical protein J7559_21155 [Cohnella sp.]|nr:hypothetical protein [Cohnella sp.]
MMTAILIVDDQINIRDGLQAMLNQFPLELERVYSAANGIEALRLLRERGKRNGGCKHHG